MSSSGCAPIKGLRGPKDMTGTEADSHELAQFSA